MVRVFSVTCPLWWSWFGFSRPLSEIPPTMIMIGVFSVTGRDTLYDDHDIKSIFATYFYTGREYWPSLSYDTLSKQGHKAGYNPFNPSSPIPFNPDSPVLAEVQRWPRYNFLKNGAKQCEFWSWCSAGCMVSHMNLGQPNIRSNSPQGSKSFQIEISNTKNILFWDPNWTPVGLTSVRGRVAPENRIQLKQTGQLYCTLFSGGVE